MFVKKKLQTCSKKSARCVEQEYEGFSGKNLRIRWLQWISPEIADYVMCQHTKNIRTIAVPWYFNFTFLFFVHSFKVLISTWKSGVVVYM
jgi:hypothetical protein